MAEKNKGFLKKYLKRIDEAPSPYHYLLWGFLVGSYFLWAALSPMFPNAKGVEPLTPLIIFCILVALFFIDRPHRLSNLVSLSLFTIIAAPSILVLNIYRAFSGLYPTSWNQAGFWRGPVVFIGLQLLGLLLTGCIFNYTVKRWNIAADSERKEIKRQALFLLILMLILLIPLFFFVFIGIIRRAG